jgi:outer membrane protein assembly factor BamB
MLRWSGIFQLNARKLIMKPNRITIFLLFLVMSIMFSSCSGTMQATSWPGMTIQNDVVYVAYMNFVQAVNLSDGSMLWKYPEKADTQKVFYAAPAVADSVLVVGDYQNALFGLDPKTGAEKWKFAEGKNRFISSPFIEGDTILAPNADHFLYALDLNGNLKWKFETKAGIWAQPVTDGKVVYFPSMDHYLYAVNLTNGSKVWSVDMGGAIVSTPVMSKDGSIFVGTIADEFIAVDAASGKIQWRYATSGAVWSRAMLLDDQVIFGDLSGKVNAISAKTGQLTWSTDVGSPVIASGVVTPSGLNFVTEKGDMVLLNTNGDKQWTHSINGKLYTSPAISDDKLVIAITQGEKLLVALDFNGNEVWNYTATK